MSYSKEDLEQYLASNGLPAILVDMVENLLMNKPKNPHGFIVNYFLVRINMTIIISFLTSNIALSLGSIS